MKISTNTGIKLQRLFPLASCGITCPLQTSSPLKIPSGLGWGTLWRAGVCYLDLKKGLEVIPLALDMEVKNWKSKINLVPSYVRHLCGLNGFRRLEEDLNHSPEVFTLLWQELVQLRPLMPSNTQTCIRPLHIFCQNQQMLNYQLVSTETQSHRIYMVWICICTHHLPKVMDIPDISEGSKCTGFNSSSWRSSHKAILRKNTSNSAKK